MRTAPEILLLCAIVASVRAGILGVGLVAPSEHGIVLQGPSSKTTLLGPDGSHISGVAAGGTVVAPGHAGGVIAAGVAPGYVAAVPGVVAVHGLHGVGGDHEGQWVPDYNEHLYDDGSYKGDHYDGHY